MRLNLLARGWLLVARGEWIPYGNPASTGGATPGGLTALLIGGPLELWRNHRAPLLGLLGTVWGMIQSFNVIAAASAIGRAEMLAGGISLALVTTAAGLCVAIPALTFYLYFVGRVDRLVMEIDHHGQELVNLISLEALEERQTPRVAIARRKAA